MLTPTNRKVNMNYSRHSNLIHQQAGRSNCASWLVALLLLALPAAHSAGQTYTILHTFTNGLDGAYPGELVLADTMLYGTARAYGKSYYGTVFKLNTDGSSFTVLK